MVTRDDCRMYLLDTDHLGVLQRRTAPWYVTLAARIGAYQTSNFFTPIVNFHEQIGGLERIPESGSGWRRSLARLQDAGTNPDRFLRSTSCDL